MRQAISADTHRENDGMGTRCPSECRGGNRPSWRGSAHSQSTHHFGCHFLPSASIMPELMNIKHWSHLDMAAPAPPSNQRSTSPSPVDGDSGLLPWVGLCGTPPQGSFRARVTAASRSIGCQVTAWVLFYGQKAVVVSVRRSNTPPTETHAKCTDTPRKRQPRQYWYR